MGRPYGSRDKLLDLMSDGKPRSSRDIAKQLLFTDRAAESVCYRWQRENMEAMQRLAKRLSKELLEFDSKYPDLSDAEVRNRVHLLSTELRQFVTPDMRRLSIQDVEIMVAHGRMAYELTNGLVLNLRSRTTWSSCSCVQRHACS